MASIGEVLKGLYKKYGGNKSEIARQLGGIVTSQQLGQYEAGKSEPKVLFYERWKEVFGDDLQQLMKGVERNVSRGTTENEPNRRDFESWARDLIEKNTEYRLIPKTILDEEYRIILKSEIELKEQMLKNLLDSKNELISALKQEIAELRSAQRVVPAKQAQ